MKHSLPANTVIAHYRILSPLGAGGMGEVYLAQDTKLDRKVAIKFLPAELAADERARRRLIGEARAAAKLDHPNICTIHEVGEEGGRCFIVMQYVDGETLSTRAGRQPLELRYALDIAVQGADALAEAHSRGIIHRDIKPQNIMITGRGQVKVMDFGLAKVIQEKAHLESEAETQSLLTEPGMIVGTVPYMSPEQVRGEELDHRSDVFSFGVVLYELLSGRRPFEAKSAAEILSAILTREPEPLRGQTGVVPAPVERVVRKCLEKDPARRYQTTEELASNLGQVRRECESGQVVASIGEAVTVSAGAADTVRRVEWRRLLNSRVTLALAILVTLTVAGLAYALLFRSAPATHQPEIKSLAVLPLENLSGDP
ncbi:MAG: serine/threonine-protein kinase [Acidobacteriota bacterium]